ncbi:MAG: hypothetical protein J5I90_12735 [Caldilineales bacterium]|nr:hypothetical protein [Caldilineales bacterium]
MKCKSITRLRIALTGILGLYGLLMLPARLGLRGRRPNVLAGIETIDEAVIDCRESGLEGWELAAYAQRLVYEKFVFYSCRNLWDTPAQAFCHGMGYCTQYNLALRQILARLGFETRAVFSLRIRVADRPDWSMGHTWLRVSIAGETRDVCAGRAGNLPGRVHFTPIAPVRQGYALALLLSHLN